MVTFRWGESLDCIHPPAPPRGKRKKEGFPQGFIERRSIFPFGVLSNVTRKTFDLYIKGRLAKQAFDCMFNRWVCKANLRLYSPRLLLFKCRECKPLKGRKGLLNGFVQGFVKQFEAVVCRGFCTTVFILLANRGAYTFHFHTYLLKV